MQVKQPEVEFVLEQADQLYRDTPHGQLDKVRKINTTKGPNICWSCGRLFVKEYRRSWFTPQRHKTVGKLWNYWYHQWENVCLHVFVWFLRQMKYVELRETWTVILELCQQHKERMAAQLHTKKDSKTIYSLSCMLTVVDIILIIIIPTCQDWVQRPKSSLYLTWKRSWPRDRLLRSHESLLGDVNAALQTIPTLAVTETYQLTR